MVNTKLPKKGLKIAHLNISSLRNKIQSVTNLLAEGIHVLALSETHLDDTISDNLLAIQGYKIFRNDRDANGGGTAIYVQDHLPTKIRNDLMIFGTETIWVQMNLPHMKPILFGCEYRKPSSKIDYLENICTMLDKVCDLGFETFYLGDANIDWMDSKCPLKKRLHKTTSACNLVQMVNNYTRIHLKHDGSVSKTCIDHIFTNYHDLCSNALSIPVGFSDHNVVVLVRKAKLPQSGQKVLLMRSMRNFNENSFLLDVSNICWNHILESDDPNAALESFNNKFLRVIDTHAPMRKQTVRKVNCPWVDSELRDLIKQREDAKKQAVITGYESDWQVYRKLRNHIVTINKKKKRLYYENKINAVGNDKKKMWSVVNDMLGRQQSSGQSYIEVDGSFLTKSDQIANYFNDFFLSKVNTLRTNMKQSSSNISNSIIKDKIMSNKDCCFVMEPISIIKMEALLSKCKVSSPGIDNLDSKFVILAARYIAAPICHIVNLSIEKGVFPLGWKLAKVIPLSKNQSAPFSGPNSRPISLLPALSKIMEKIVHEQVQAYFETNKLNSDYQHAYRHAHSTCSALTQLTDDWHYEMDKKKLVGAVLLDFSAAFDLIDPTLLLDKLTAYGFNPIATKWMESYLTTRGQLVYFNGSFSTIRQVNCGVPQGSCLGPLLFSIFINDLPMILDQSKLAIYADDSTLWVADSSINKINKTLDLELSKVVKWVSDNKLVLNIGKTKSILLGSKHQLEENPKLDLFMNNIQIEQVYEVKLLGITIDNLMTWSKHIDNIVSRMGRGVSVVRRVSSSLTVEIRKQVLNAIVLSLMDYCFVVWSNASKSDLDRLQKAQNKAARCALNCNLRTSIDSMHVRLRWLSVSQRSSYVLLNFVRNLKVLQAPQVLYNRMASHYVQHKYHTRLATEERFTLPSVHSGKIQNSVMYRAMILWNDIPRYIILINTKDRFKLVLKQYLLSS